LKGPMKERAGVSKPATRALAPKAPEDRTRKHGRIEDKISEDEVVEESGEEGEESVSQKKKVAFREPEKAKPRANGLPFVEVPALSRPKKVYKPITESIPNIEKREPAYRHRAPIQERGNASRIVDRLLEAPVQITNEDLLGVSSSVREELKRLISRKRIALEGKAAMVNAVEDVLMEEQVREESAIQVEDLPIATYCVLQRDCEGLSKGSIVVGDPVSQYLSGLEEGEEPRKLYVSTESQSLKALYPLINGVSEEEALLDGGSQIVSMSQAIALKLNLSWDPTVVIHMQSANRQVEKTLGLARNVPFLFGEITVYLQVHIIREPAYKVLLGRPFDALTKSEVKNSKDGAQLVTITDPNTGNKVTLPTYTRGQTPRILKRQTIGSFHDSRI